MSHQSGITPPVSMQQLGKARRAVDILVGYLTHLGSKPIGSLAWFVVLTDIHVQVPVVERWLDLLGKINDANWPDPKWALDLPQMLNQVTGDLRELKQSLQSPQNDDRALLDRCRSLSGKLRTLDRFIGRQL
jgi:hypothetical protein